MNTEEHIKNTNEKVLDLDINDTETDIITEAFGWERGKFLDLCKTMRNYQRFIVAAEELHPELPKHTKTSLFVDFLKSDSFKNLGIKITTPNDYFVLGFAFSSTYAQAMNPLNLLESLVGGGL